MYEVEFECKSGFEVLQLASARGITVYWSIAYDSIADKAAASGHVEALL